MHNYCHKLSGLLIAALTLVLSSGCGSNVKAPQINYSEVNEKNSENTNKESQIDLEQEAFIEKQCLDAWRKCIAGNKKEGIADLKELSKQYPKSSTVLFMTGQVLEKFGNKKEAIAYYEKAANNSDFAIMSLFKIAESLRTTSNTKESIIRYRKLVNIAPKFAEAHFGLARALITLDPASEEGKKELKIVIELDPSNKKAKELLNSYKIND